MVCVGTQIVLLRLSRQLLPRVQTLKLVHWVGHCGTAALKTCEAGIAQYDLVQLHVCHLLPLSLSLLVLCLEWCINKYNINCRIHLCMHVERSNMSRWCLHKWNTCYQGEIGTLNCRLFAHASHVGTWFLSLVGSILRSVGYPQISNCFAFMFVLLQYLLMAYIPQPYSWAMCAYLPGPFCLMHNSARSYQM